MTNKKLLSHILFAIIFLTAAFSAHSQSVNKKIINIWDNVESMKHCRVIMEVWIPEDCNGSAAIICAGGSYDHLGIVTESYSTAKWFNSNKSAAFILWYRVAKNNWHYPAMMEDIQRAIQLVRTNAGEYKINPDKIATIGFSAGGHLVCWAGEFGNRIDHLKKLGIESTVSLRPNLTIPVYPVVTMDEDIGHAWSRKSLIGKNPSQEERDSLSLEKNVPDDMIPTYLIACQDDPVVIYENSVRLAQALKEKNTDYCFKTYPWGGHGFGMLNNKFMKTFRWNDDLKIWLTEKGFF
ncbi:MAG: alpha/beta hydrolase [Treponema sp.]|nr:alpha/beta hydrolase [Treponema sp.]